MQFHRCSICNKTNNEDVETDLGDFTTMTFVPDPKSDLHFVCLECYEMIASTLWEMGDDSLMDSFPIKKREDNDTESEDTTGSSG